MLQAQPIWYAADSISMLSIHVPNQACARATPDFLCIFNHTAQRLCCCATRALPRQTVTQHSLLAVLAMHTAALLACSTFLTVVCACAPALCTWLLHLPCAPALCPCLVPLPCAPALCPCLVYNVCRPCADYRVGSRSMTSLMHEVTALIA